MIEINGINNGKKHTEEAKEKNRQSHLGKPNGCLGTKRSEESKKKMSEARKKYFERLKNGG